MTYADKRNVTSLGRASRLTKGDITGFYRDEVLRRETPGLTND